METRRRRNVCQQHACPSSLSRFSCVLENVGDFHCSSCHDSTFGVDAWRCRGLLFPASTPFRSTLTVALRVHKCGFQHIDCCLNHTATQRCCGYDGRLCPENSQRPPDNSAVDSISRFSWNREWLLGDSREVHHKNRHPIQSASVRIQIFAGTTRINRFLRFLYELLDNGRMKICSLTLTIFNTTTTKMDSYACSRPG